MLDLLPIVARRTEPSCSPRCRRASGIRMCLALVAALFLVGGSSAFGADPEARSPNVLIIVTDDQAPQTLSVYGNTVCKTPHLDRLAARGVVLDDAHHMGSWSGAVCLPSRTMIMTGRSVWRIPGAKGPGYVFPRDETRRVAADSLPALFRRAGYDTFRTCKNGNSFAAANALFEDRATATKRKAGRGEGSDWHGDQVISFLDRRDVAGDPDPFLIYLGFSLPHDPRYADTDRLAKYGASNDAPFPTSELTPPLPQNYLPAHPFPHGHPGLRDEERVQGVMKDRTPATVRNELGREYACLDAIDEQVGRVLARLEALGELERTIVVFTSDHGIAVGRHGLMGKQNLYEHSWRVPFFISGPGIPAGRRASGFAMLCDILPTVCDLAGVPGPKDIEGRSLRPVLDGRQERIRDVLYGVYCGGTKPGMRAVKVPGWKLIRTRVLDGTVDRTQLFDLTTNPHEWVAAHHEGEVKTLLRIEPEPHQTNLVDDPRPEVVSKRAELLELLRREMERLGDPYRDAFGP